MKTTILDLPGCRLHVCDTGDALADTCFAFESPTAIVCLEAPAFQPDVDAWKTHLATLGKPIVAVLTPYHVGGAEQLGETWATARTCASLQPGGPIHGIVTGFKEAFHGFDLDLPAAKLTATHLFGADCHSLLLSPEAIDAAIAQCDRLAATDTQIILSTHHLPEGPDAIPTKRDYLLRVKEIAATAKDATTFIAAVKAAYPTLAAEAYLNMTAQALFK